MKALDAMAALPIAIERDARNIIEHVVSMERDLKAARSTATALFEAAHDMLSALEEQDEQEIAAATIALKKIIGLAQ